VTHGSMAGALTTQVLDNIVSSTLSSWVHPDITQQSAATEPQIQTS
jgi:hypothetical protein